MYNYVAVHANHTYYIHCHLCQLQQVKIILSAALGIRYVVENSMYVYNSDMLACETHT